MPAAPAYPTEDTGVLPDSTTPGAVEVSPDGTDPAGNPTYTQATMGACSVSPAGTLADTITFTNPGTDSATYEANVTFTDVGPTLPEQRTWTGVVGPGESSTYDYADAEIDASNVSQCLGYVTKLWRIPPRGPSRRVPGPAALPVV